MNALDIRWIQRLSNFERSFLLLCEALKIESLPMVERAGLIRFFEMAFELSWKLLKDYEEMEGFAPKTPREVIKQAFQAELVRDGHGWVNALQDCNLTSHTYNEKVAIDVENRIRIQYFLLLKELYEMFKSKLEED